MRVELDDSGQKDDELERNRGDDEDLGFGQLLHEGFSRIFLGGHATHISQEPHAHIDASLLIGAKLDNGI